jgi:lipopolysaccharide/colanic/teichoic acid biosynthesis glycosyltransferase
MRVDAEDEDGPQWAKEADGRRLKVGAFMRKWNIDELPQFWNVLKGEPNALRETGLSQMSSVVRS